MAVPVGVALLLSIPIAMALSPLSIPASQYWDGDDGPWSSFKVTIGTPLQNIRVYPASSQSSVWAVLPEGCTGNEPSDCKDSRGLLFNKNSSITWSEKGLFELTTTEENFLGHSGNGDWGYDTVMLGWQGDGLPTMNNTLVTGIATPTFYLGALGLNNQPINFTTFNDPQASFLKNLKDQGKIPSLSWGYTAGASYQSDFGFGSLTLGGYDTTRFVPNNVTFPFGPDSSRDLLVAIQTIRSSTTQSSLMPTPEFLWIDSLESQIWLPTDACTAFEKAFDLTWNDTSRLYLVNDSLHDHLVSLNPNVTFRLGSDLYGGNTVDITLPYAAFDLKVNGSTRYFPLQRAANDTQYTLGRAFLQEAYVTVDYERSTFQVQQAVFPNRSTSQSLVPIEPLNGTSAQPVSHSSGLSTGAEAGVIVGGAVLAIALVSIAVFLCIRQRRKARVLPELPANLPQRWPSDRKPVLNVGSATEIASFGKAELPVDGQRPRHELAVYDHQRNELHSDSVVQAEMMGSPVNSDYKSRRADRSDESRWGTYSTNNVSTLGNHPAFRMTSIHELPAHVPLQELDSSESNSLSTGTTSPSSKLPVSPATGSSPAVGNVSAFPRDDTRVWNWI